MAVEDKYVNANLVAGTKAKPALTTGAEEVVITAIASIAAADTDASVYRLARVNANFIPTDVICTNDAITGGTDYEIGIYNTKDGPLAGVAKDIDALLGTTSMASARAEGSGISGLSAVALADSQKQIWELAGDTAADHPSEYDIVLTANTVGSAAGSVVVKMRFAQG